MAEGSEFEPSVPVSELQRRHHVKICGGQTNCPDRARLRCGRRYCRDVQRKHFAERAKDFASACPL